jgi:hypothetical protein
MLNITIPSINIYGESSDGISVTSVSYPAVYIENSSFMMETINFGSPLSFDDAANYAMTDLSSTNTLNCIQDSYRTWHCNSSHPLVWSWKLESDFRTPQAKFSRLSIFVHN